ncbi:hypothetical protein GCM10027418_07780 [Mariniluteicoccus endophyticus]
MIVSALALATALAALAASRARSGVRGLARGAGWAVAALLVAWLVGYAALVRAGDPTVLAGVPGARPLALGGWAGAALAVAGALRARPRPVGSAD